MKNLAVFISMVLIYLESGIGSGKIQVQVPSTTYAEEAITVNCTGSMQDFKSVPVPLMSLKTRHGCINHDDVHRIPVYLNNLYQASFTITCEKGNHMITCKTSSQNHKPNKAIKLQVIEKPPKITTKPHNITSNIGLPVTLECYVEGDPNHYWVGWMSRQTVIQSGEEHSISTSPNFMSTNGTAHHLTIHSVKEDEKYECKVYTITGDVQDQVTHQVLVSNNDGEREPSSSLWDFFRRYS